MKNKYILTLIASVAFLAISTALFLIIPQKTQNFWVGYGVFALAMVQFAVVNLCAYSSKSIVVPRVAISWVSFCYLIASSVFSIIGGFALSASDYTQNWFTAIHVLLVAVFIVILLLLVFSKQHIEAVEQDQTERNKVTMQGFER